MSVETVEATDVQQPLQQSLRNLQIDFLFLDLNSCTRCRGTDRSLGEALTVVADVLLAAGLAVEVNRVHVATEELARAWRFVSSPTIRVNGSDIALGLRESSCGSEACTDGCGDSIACRVWVYRGQEYTEPPTELIVDAILRHAYGAPTAPAPAHHYEMPENLRRFFAGKSAAQELTHPIQDVEPADPIQPVALVQSAEAGQTGCCSSAEEQTCCGASAKADCCGAETGQGCGCR